MDCERIELGIVVNLRNLRDVLRSLSVGGRQWWFASDPVDAIEKGCLSVGYGYPGCVHALNASYYRIPVLNKELPITGTEDVVVVIESSVCIAEQPGFYFEDGKLVPGDALETFQSFFSPLQRSLLARLQALH